MDNFFKALLLPSNIAISLVVVGIGLLFVERFRNTARTFVIIGVCSILLFSISTIASLILNPLEYKYLSVEQISAKPDINKIVVLTGYAVDYPYYPTSSKLNSASTFRVLEAYRLYQHCTGCKIIISGKPPTTRIMQSLLIELGIPSENMKLDNEANHTYMSAKNLLPMLHQERFFLVTSAGHMPRSVGVFEKLGMKPLPAPTDYKYPKNPLDVDLSISPHHLYRTNLAVREYAGMVWYQLTGKI